MVKIILKRGRLSEGEKAIITLKHKETSVEELAQKLKRNPTQIQKFIENELSSGSKQENVDSLNSASVNFERTGVATVMTESEASKPSTKSPTLKDPDHIFRQPK